MHHRTKLLFILLAACLVMLQAGAISRRSFWEDEAATASLAPMEFGAIVRNRASDNHPPLYWLSAAVWGRVFGYDEWGLKSYSLLWLLIAFFLVIKLAGLLYDERSAMMAATLMVFSPYILTYGHNARYYAMSAAISLFLAWMVKIYVDRGRWTALVLYVLAGVALLYTLYMGVAVLIALNVWYLLAAIRQKVPLPQIAGWIVAQIIVVASYLPWLSIFMAAASRNLDRSLELGNPIVELLVRFGYLGYAYLNGEFYSPTNPLVWLLILLAVLVGILAGRSALKNSWLPLSILFVGLTLSVIVNLVSVYPQSAWQNLSNRTFFVFPFFVIWLAGSLATLRPKFTYISLGIVLLVFAGGIFNYFNDAQMVKPLLAVPWREIMQEIDEQKTPQSVAICSGGDTACNYYLRLDELDGTGLWDRERILKEPPPDLWWIQINLGAPNLRDDLPVSYLDRLKQVYQSPTVFNYAPQDRSIRRIKTEVFHQIDYEYRVSLYHFSPAPVERSLAFENGSPVPSKTAQAFLGEPVATDEPVPTPTDKPVLTATSQPSGTVMPVEPTEAIHQVYLPPPGQISGIEVIPNRADRELPLVQQAGAVWIRANAILWADVEQVQGQRNWTAIEPLEDLMITASEQGLQTIMIVRGTPSWARKYSGSQCGPIRENKFQAFADFMVDLLDRYSDPPYNVKYWEIWNEPDVDPSLVKSDSIYGCWGDQTDIFYGGQYYGSLLKTVYPQVKAARPDVKIVAGGLLLDCDPLNPPEWPIDSGQVKDCSSSRFFEGVLESGAGHSFDAVSFHAYDYYGEKLGVYSNFNWHSSWDTTGPVAIKKVEYLRGLLARFGLQKEILDTEAALICISSQAICSTETYDLTKAYYAAISLSASRMLGLSANIWYSTLGWRSSGLFGADYQPLPVYKSYRFSIQELDHAMFRREIDEYPGLSGYEFERNGTTIWIIWSREAAGQTIQLAKAPAAVYDVFGSPQATGRELFVSTAPIYLEWAPE